MAKRLSLEPQLICSGSRQQKYSEARSLVAWLAVEEVGHPAAEVARFLGISRMGVHKAVITCPPPARNASQPVRHRSRSGEAGGEEGNSKGIKCLWNGKLTKLPTSPLVSPRRAWALPAPSLSTGNHCQVAPSLQYSNWGNTVNFSPVYLVGASCQATASAGSS